MRRPTVSIAVTSLFLACAVLAPSASASTASVRESIEHSSKQVKESGELQSALKELKEEPKTLEKVHSGIAKFDSVLRKVVAKVELQKASTASGKTGKTDWVSGFDKVIKGFSDLDKAITDLKTHDKAAAKTEVEKAASLVKAGAVEVKKGDALLHVKKSS